MASAFNKAERRKGLREAPEQLEQLRQKWPKAFSAKSHEVRPLAAGTTKTVATEFGWSYQYARAVLERWKLRNDYCRAVLAYQKRYTLEGKESDELVDERAKMLAREMIENRQARRQRQAAKEQGTRIARLVEDLDDETARSAVSSEHAHEVLTAPEKLKLSERDSLLVLDLLENPPEPSARLLRAARAGFVRE